MYIFSFFPFFFSGKKKEKKKKEGRWQPFRKGLKWQMMTKLFKDPFNFERTVARQEWCIVVFLRKSN